jgi:hypothetical protein
MQPIFQHRSVRSYLKNLELQKYRFFCVSCKKERHLAPPARIGSPRFFVQIAITTAFCALLTWPWMGWKGALAFLIPVGLVFEAGYRLKMRASLVCPDCKFDPILYLVNRERAVAEVEAAWRKKFEEKGLTYPVRKTQKGVPRRSLDLVMTSGVNQGHGNQQSDSDRQSGAKS